MLLVMFLSNLYITCYISFCPAEPQISGYFDKHLGFLSLKCNLNLSLNGRQYKCGELLNSYFHWIYNYWYGGLSFLSQVEAEAGSYNLFCVHESQCAKYICNIQVYI